MKKPAIICVDDQATILDSLKIELKTTLSNDYVIETTESGEDALELLHELLEEGHEVPLVISDYLMPEMKGDELLKCIHDISPKTLKIMLTGQADVKAVGNAIKYAKLYRYIAKPWQLDDLKLTVKEAINSYYLEKQLAEQNLQLQLLNEELENLVEKRTAALKKEQEKFAKAFRSTPHAITITRLSDGKHLEVNDAFCQQTGYTSEEIIGRTALELDLWVNVKDRSQLFQLLKNCGTVRNYEFEFRTKSGKINTALLSAEEIDLDGQTCLISVSQDISDRKRTEAELRKSEERWQLVLKANNDAIWDANLQTGEVFRSTRWKEILGYEESEISNSTDEWKTRIHPDDFDRVTAAIQQHLDRITPFYFAEYRLRCKDGSYKWIQDRGQAVWDSEGNPIRLLGSQSDINDRKQGEIALQKAKEAADQANRAKSEFLANMSHELRTPLNAILGFTQLLARDSSLQGEQQEHLAIINRSGEHLLNLINNILQMSKIEVGRVTVDNKIFDLHPLLESLEGMLQLQAEKKGLQLIFDRDPNLPRYAIADENKLRQVLINLIGNAIKFTQEGGVTLRVKMATGNEQEKSPMTHSLLFEIEDTGPGIAPEDLENLFKPFVQTETGRRAQEGTGLGLPISKQFVQLMGGDITVSSIVDRGSIFKFHIKISLADSMEFQPIQITRRVIGLEPGQPDYRILAVDDRTESRLLLTKLLTSLGFSVRAAENGLQAVEEWENWQPHLIWMDMRMPVMNGYEATQRIKAHDKGKETIVIALTASAFDEERSEILSAGCDDFVAKPFREQVILDKISHYLGVRYLYEQQDLSNAWQGGIPGGAEGSKTDSSFVLTATSFQVMPLEWVNELYDAADSINNELILQMVAELPPEHEALGAAIANLVDNFRCDQIIDLIDQFRNS